jgi:hypothetical protein
MWTKQLLRILYILSVNWSVLWLDSDLDAIAIGVSYDLTNNLDMFGVF